MVVKYKLRKRLNGIEITQDGHTMFLDDVVKKLNRMQWLEQQRSGTRKVEDAIVFSLVKCSHGDVITKDGHVMFFEDVVKWLNRSAMLNEVRVDTVFA